MSGNKLLTGVCTDYQATKEKTNWSHISEIVTVPRGAGEKREEAGREDLPESERFHLQKILVMHFKPSTLKACVSY